MKKITCYNYKLDASNVYENKTLTLEYKHTLNDKEILDYRQLSDLKFKVGDVVYVACRGYVRQCKVIDIYQIQNPYDENIDALYTCVDLDDINDFKNTFAFCTTAHSRDLNSTIKLTPQELYNFNYEKSL